MCAVCNTAFKQYSTVQRFCSRQCWLTGTKQKRTKRTVARSRYSEADRDARTAKLQNKLDGQLSDALGASQGGTQQDSKHGSKFGWIEFVDRRFYMRSSWERNYARYLEWLVSKGEIMDWDYECTKFVFESIKFGNRSYLPDFKVTETDGSHYWVEVKGYMTKASITKLSRMSRYYPDENVQILDGEAYRALAKDAKRLIPEWE